MLNILKEEEEKNTSFLLDVHDFLYAVNWPRMTLHDDADADEGNADVESDDADDEGGDADDPGDEANDVGDEADDDGDDTDDAGDEANDKADETDADEGNADDTNVGFVSDSGDSLSYGRSGSRKRGLNIGG